MSFVYEVLSPAGSDESLVAAVRSGADAVYIGAKQFSARRNADNFDNIADAVRYCRIRGVKVYLALNIMLKQSELSDALSLAYDAYKSGVDAVIVCDLGLASLIKKRIPDLTLHASTQMTVHSPSALPLLKEMGFSRVVVSREMSKTELAELCKKAKALDIEVEAFVHGALCMSVSGQCLMSSVLGARSGNRGLCAGPCRLPFAADGGSGYDLSLKDLCLYEYISELKKLGVTSFKIEGRMKRPEYVAAATAACSQAVDSGHVEPQLFDTLQKVFSRSGFTDGYYNGKLGADMFGTRTKDDVISANDTYSYLHEIYRAERQSVPIKMTAEILSDKQTSLTVTDGNNTVAVTGDAPQSAKTRALQKENVADSLTKLGGTAYRCESIDITLDDGLFLAASSLNALRREATERLDIARAAFAPSEYTLPQINTVGTLSGNRSLIARFAAKDQIPQDISTLKAIILPYECEMPTGIDATIIAELPRYISDENKIINRLSVLKQQGIEWVYCGNPALIEIAKNTGFKIFGATGLNVHNNESLKVLKQMGVDAAMLSVELSLKELELTDSEIPVGIFAYGCLPLMLTRNCPIKNGKTCAECGGKSYLTDRKGVQFAVRCREGYSEVLNSVPVYMADRLTEIPPVDYLLLYFTDEDTTECQSIINNYISGKPLNRDYTRNLYYKNLI